MNILFLIQKPQARGQEIFASLLGNYFLELGHEVSLVSLYSGDFRLPFLGKMYSLEVEGTSWRSLRKLSQLIRTIRPDLIQANGGDTLKFAVLSRLIFPFEGKLVFNNGGVVGYYLKSSLHRLVYKFLLGKVDAAVSVSEFSAKDLRNWIPARIPQAVIPVGIPSDRTYSLAPPSTQTVFVHIGGFTPEKNHEFLMKAFQKYRDLDPSSELWLIGGGPLRKQVEEQAFELAGGSVKFLGEREEPWKEVPKNAVLLLPSRVEGTPAVLMEACLAEIPAVAFSVGGIPEMMKGLASCLLIEPERSDDFVKFMGYWVNLEDNERVSRCKESRGLAVARFSLEGVSGLFLDFYKNL